MRNVFVVGPVSWNQLVYLDRLPEPRPHTIFARHHVEALGGTSAGKSVAAGTHIVVLTQGAAGATAVTSSGQMHVPCAPVEQIVDTNGAGDAFFAGFLLTHLEGAPIDEALRAGHAQAARCLASPGLATCQEGLG